nr:ribosomal protein S6 [Proteomonas sp. NEIS-1375]
MTATDTNLNTYETIYIVRPDLNEDSLLKIIETYQGTLIERGAQDLVTQNRGRRHLKYNINKFRDGVYIQMNYKGNGELIAFLERSMKINENIMRVLTTKVNITQSQ